MMQDPSIDSNLSRADVQMSEMALPVSCFLLDLKSIKEPR
jgi:hypothetical protein